MKPNKAACRKSVDLLLGWPLKKAPHDKLLKLFALSICAMTMEQCLAGKPVRQAQGKKGKRSAATRSLNEMSRIMYKEILRRMK